MAPHTAAESKAAPLGADLDVLLGCSIARQLGLRPAPGCVCTLFDVSRHKDLLASCINSMSQFERQQLIIHVFGGEILQTSFAPAGKVNTAILSEFVQ